MSLMKQVLRTKPIRTTKKAVACVSAARKPIELVSLVNLRQIGYSIQTSPLIGSLSSTLYFSSGFPRLSLSQKHVSAPLREMISLKFVDKLSIFYH